MDFAPLPILLFVLASSGVAVGLMVAGKTLGPKRQGAVKQMPYESGMDPIHDTRRRFDIRFHLVAIAFLVFDVELLFLYPWAVAAKSAPEGQPVRGLDAAVADGLVCCRGLIFSEVLLFIGLLAVGLAYAWRKGVFKWR
ncbi:MAG: NADH-quinone oxidoreductase subunit A [Pirellulales bacterium]